MDGSELRECLETIGWSMRHLATVLGRDETTVRRWGRDAPATPAQVAAWLALLAQAHRAAPPPAMAQEPPQARASRGRAALADRNRSRAS